MARYQITYPTTPRAEVLAGVVYISEGTVVTTERRIDERRSVDRAVVEVADPDYFEQQIAELFTSRMVVVRLS